MRSRSVAFAITFTFSLSAEAFDDPGQFFGAKNAATSSASAEGIYFTGAPRFAGLDCGSCHTDAAGAIDIKIGADPAELFATGYRPGQTYQLEVELLNEQKGLQYNTPSGTCTESQKQGYVQCNNNNFALEIDGSNGPLGGFCSQSGCPKANPFGDETEVAPGGDAVFANRIHDQSMPKTVKNNGENRWHLWWTAPAAGSGPLTLYVAAVDGNGGSGSADDDQDPLGDDVVTAVVTIGEAGALVSIGPHAGCALVPHPASAPGVLLLALALLALRARRRADGGVVIDVGGAARVDADRVVGER